MTPPLITKPLGLAASKETERLAVAPREDPLAHAPQASGPERAPSSRGLKTSQKRDWDAELDRALANPNLRRSVGAWDTPRLEGCGSVGGDDNWQAPGDSESTRGLSSKKGERKREKAQKGRRTDEDVGPATAGCFNLSMLCCRK